MNSVRLLRQLGLGLAILLAVASTVAAQGSIQQSGPITLYRPGSWYSNGVQGDGGTPSSPFLSATGLFDGSNCPFGVSSQTGPGVSPTPHSLFTICQTNASTTLNFLGVNGQPTPSVYFNIGGETFPFPGPGGGTVLGPQTSIVGDLACFNTTMGTILSDCGRLTLPTTTALLSAFGAGVTPAQTVFTKARDTNDTYSFGGGAFNYDSTIPAPQTITASVATLPGATTLTVTVGSSIAAGEFVTGSGVPAGEFILPFGTNSTTGTGGTGTYALYLPATISSESMVATADNGGSVRVDAAGHGFRFSTNQQVTADLFGAYQQNTATANDGPLQNALSATYYAACFNVAQGNSPPGAASATLWFNATNSTGYQFSTPKFIGAPGPNFQCYNPPILRGRSKLFGSTITGVLTSAAPALDFSGTGGFTLEDIGVRATGASATVACFDGRIATSASGLGTPNTATLINSVCDASAATGSYAAAMFQDADLLFVDSQSRITGYTATPTTAGPYGPMIAVTIGETLPYSPLPGAYGVAQAGTTNTITLTSGATSTVNAFVGSPIRVYPTNSSGICTGSFEPGYITAYNSSTKVATVSQNWSSFTPTSAACYAIYATGSAFQPYAGLSPTNGATYYRMGGTYYGAVWHTGGTSVSFVDNPYIAEFGNPAAAMIEDQGNECISQPTEWSGGLAVESYGSNSVMIWPKSGQMKLINVWGRLSGPFQDAMLRFTSSDRSASTCLPSGTPWDEVLIKTPSAFSASVFDSSVGTANSLLLEGEFAQMGSIGAIAHCELDVDYDFTLADAAKCLRGGFNFTSLTGVYGEFSGPSGIAVGSPNTAVPTSSVVPTLTVSTTTGGSAQLRYAWTFPSNLINQTGLSFYLGVQGDIDVSNVASSGTTAVAFTFVQGSTTTAIASVTIPASGGQIHLHFMMGGHGGYLPYEITSGAAVLASGVAFTPVSAGSSFAIQMTENNAAGDATNYTADVFQRVASH